MVICTFFFVLYLDPGAAVIAAAFEITASCLQDYQANEKNLN